MTGSTLDLKAADLPILQIAVGLCKNDPSIPIPLPSFAPSANNPPNIPPVAQISDLNDWTDHERPTYKPQRTIFHEDQNNLARLVDDDKVFGGATTQVALADEDYDKDHSDIDSTSVSYELQVENTIGSGSGLLLGTVLYSIIKGKFRGRRSLNPLYRTFKLGANVGSALGMPIGYMLPLPKNLQKIAGNLFANIFSLGIALLAFPYWLLREYVFQTPAEQKNINARTGNEGWSKYGKTLLVFGVALGQVIGAIHSYTTGANLLVDIGIAGGVTGVGLCLLGMVLIPVINRLTGGALKTDKDTFRNNYVRTGMLLGASIGSTLGFILGTCFLPGIGSSIGMTIGGAIGSIIGGTYYGVAGKNISKRIHGGRDCENSWDYGSRSVLYIGSAIGTCAAIALSIFCPAIGGAILVNAALGAAIGGIAGWYAGYKAVEYTAKNRPQEKYAHSTPWTQRMATGSNIFSIVGGAAGLIVGLVLGGPLGAIIGGSLGYALGSIIGSIIAIFYDPKPTNSSEATPLYDTREKVFELADFKKATPKNSVDPANDIPRTPRRGNGGFDVKQGDVQIPPQALLPKKNIAIPEIDFAASSAKRLQNPHAFKEVEAFAKTTTPAIVTNFESKTDRSSSKIETASEPEKKLPPQVKQPLIITIAKKQESYRNHSSVGSHPNTLFSPERQREPSPSQISNSYRKSGNTVTKRNTMDSTLYSPPRTCPRQIPHRNGPKIPHLQEHRGLIRVRV